MRWGEGANAVSAVHRDEVAYIDPDARLVAITNGDNRLASRSVFNSIFHELFGENTDDEQPTGDEIRAVKQEAKKRLGLNPGQIVISYSGRLVPEKAGRSRAFTNENIEALVKGGAQVIIYGNVQGSEDSKAMYRDLKELEGRLDEAKKEKPEEYPGRLIVRTGWGLSEQIELLAATDVQVQDSDRGTGASEYTEADISANGGLQFSPPWIEGIISRQGIVADRSEPGSGNTVIPYADSPQSYLEALMWLV